MNHNIRSGKFLDIFRSMIIVYIIFFSVSTYAMGDYFWCNTSKGKLILKINMYGLVYNMVNSNGKGLYFSSPGPSYKDYLYNHYSRFQTDYINVSFERNGYKYIVFSNYEDGISIRGVTVLNLSTKKEFTYPCEDEGIDKLSDLSMKLKCDKNSALGCQ